MSYGGKARVHLMTLSVRTSGKGTEYLSGYLGKARVVGFMGEPDKYGNLTWNIYVSEPESRAEERPDASPPRRDQAHQRPGNGR